MRSDRDRDPRVGARRPLLCSKPDAQTVRALLASIRSDLPTVCERIRVAVTGGCASLAGEVLAFDVRRKIEDTLDRLAMIDAIAITVESPGAKS